METELQLKDRQRIERFKAGIPPISPVLMPLLILGGGVLLAATFFALGAEFIFVWPTFAVFGFAILSLNRFVVRRRLERLEEAHRIEKKMLLGALRSRREPPSD